MRCVLPLLDVGNQLDYTQPMSSRIPRIVSVLAVWTSLAGGAFAGTLSFGVVPEQEKEILVKKWQPLLDALSKQAGVKIVLDTSAKDIDDFYKKFFQAEFDLALVNPQAYSVKMKRGMYDAFARQDAKLQGLLVVSKSSSFQSLKDLRGKRIALPSPESYAASTLNLIELRAAGLDPGKDLQIAYLGNHDKVYEAVATGKADAGGGVMRTFTQAKSDVLDRLRIFHTTAPSLTHPFVANGRLPIAVKLDIRRALLNVSGTPEGAALLKNVGMGKIIAASDSDYDQLRKPGS